MEKEVLRGDRICDFLPVQDVQALASKNQKDIPCRYIRPEVEFDVVSRDESLQIPVIDMSKLDHEDELRKLHLAFKDWGFFQLINHEVGDEVIEKMKIDVPEFFKLALEEKMACAQIPNKVEGYGQTFLVSEDQKLDWGDMLFLIPLPASERNMRFWPTTPPSFRATLDKYSMELQKVMIQLMRLIAKNLPVFLKMGGQGIRVNYYPPCPQASQVFGIAPHSDAVGLTLLIQVIEVEGLQIRRNGKWVPVKPIPGTFIVNVGDIIEIMSNGDNKSIEHRAVVNPEKERVSIVALHNPNMSTMIGPLPELVKVNEAKYRTIPFQVFLRLRFSSKLNGKGLVNQMKL